MRSPSAIPAAGLLSLALALAGAGTAAVGDTGGRSENPKAPTGNRTTVDTRHVAKAEGSAANGKQPYKVKCGEDGPPCRVGHKTYLGWRAFAGFCERCHGPGGVGSALGPNLIERIPGKPIDRQRFMRVVKEGWDGPMKGIMPAFGQNPNVTDRLDELWRYLQARVDGKIGPGRPEQIGQEPLPEDAPANWE